MKRVVHYDPLCYAPSSSCVVTRTANQQRPTTPTTNTVAAPKAPSSIQTLVDNVRTCHQCNHDAHDAPAEVFVPGQVAVHRPPFHCYNVESLNVLPPRPIREPEVQTVTTTQAPTCTPTTRGNPSCVGCRFCHHNAEHVGSSASPAERAEVLGLRRDALNHKRHAKKKSVQGSSATQAPHRTPPPTQLCSTNLVLCSACGCVLRRVCESEEALDQLRTAPCGKCRAVGSLMRLLVDDRHGVLNNNAPAPPPSEPHVEVRPRTPLENVASIVKTLPHGVVPMEDRRTSLGERIRIGRARVPSPHRAAAVQESLSTTGISASLAKWAREPLSANDSENAKGCLTWST